MLIIQTMNLKAQSNHTDSTTVSSTALRRILVAAEQKKVLDSQIVILNQRIDSYNQIIKTLNDKDTATVGSYERQITAMKDQRGIFETQIKADQKEITKLRRKVFITSIAGVAGIAILGVLYLTK